MADMSIDRPVTGAAGTELMQTFPTSTQAVASRLPPQRLYCRRGNANNAGSGPDSFSEAVVKKAFLPLQSAWKVYDSKADQDAAGLLGGHASLFRRLRVCHKSTKARWRVRLT